MIVHHFIQPFGRGFLATAFPLRSDDVVPTLGHTIAVRVYDPDNQYGHN